MTFRRGVASDHSTKEKTNTVSARDKERLCSLSIVRETGKGNYTYCAYSFHRQLPYAVEGAYRIMANLISYGKK